jgi:hypothetical protein
MCNLICYTSVKTKVSPLPKKITQVKNKSSYSWKIWLCKRLNTRYKFIYQNETHIQLIQFSMSFYSINTGSDGRHMQYRSTLRLQMQGVDLIRASSGVPEQEVIVW